MSQLRGGGRRAGEGRGGKNKAYKPRNYFFSVGAPRRACVCQCEALFLRVSPLCSAGREKKREGITTDFQSIHVLRCGS